MVDTLILWGHAIAALMFGALAIMAWRAPRSTLPRAALVAALLATAIWALGVAGIGGGKGVTRVAESVRNLAWLYLMFALRAQAMAGVARGRGWIALASVYGVLALVIITAVATHLMASASQDAVFTTAANSAALLLRIMVVLAGLVLAQNLFVGGRTSGVRAVALMVAAMWLIDLNILTLAYVSGEWPTQFVAVRGIAVAVLAMVAAAIGQRAGDVEVRLSRKVTFQSLSALGIGLYFTMLAVATSALEAFGGNHARLFQTAFVFGSTTAVLTLLSSPWLRAWAKVKLAKHFFRHRYDYRAEWIRFTETLGKPEGAAPLEERIVKAIADFTDSPAGVLLVPDGGGLGIGVSWNWDRSEFPLAGGEIIGQIDGERVIEIDAVRAGTAEAIDIAAIPAWIRDLPEAWALVPLPHMGVLAGAILLARPPVDRALDWEDFDLLKVAGRQVASYLAEARVQEALMEARRFEEFNRRFAFILHDLKNLVSQLSLVARNAERHADNPDFRADMVATLKESVGRMNDLLARLSQNHIVRPDVAEAVAVMPLIERVAGSRRAQHVVTTSGDADAGVVVDPARLELLLGHLIQNAIEASRPGDPVEIVVTGGHEVAIDVIDHGAGMSPAFVRDQLFRPFVSSKPGGFGIGAFEALQLAQAMGGRLDVTSREGEGSRFRLTLPAATESPQTLERAA